MNRPGGEGARLRASPQLTLNIDSFLRCERLQWDEIYSGCELASSVRFPMLLTSTKETLVSGHHGSNLRAHCLDPIRRFRLESSDDSGHDSRERGRRNYYQSSGCVGRF